MTHTKNTHFVFDFNYTLCDIHSTGTRRPLFNNQQSRMKYRVHR
ncbi:Uncharacterised protein [Serratia fonticola]|nr:Uncharacterised protein [Serratia fonticola]